MSDTIAYGDLAVWYGAKPCAFAAAAERTSPADINHPVNSFMARHSCSAPRGQSIFALVPATTSSQNRAVLGPDRGGLAGNPARPRRPCRQSGRTMRPAPFMRLLCRKKFGMAEVRTA